MIKKIIFALLFVGLFSGASAQQYQLITDLPYYKEEVRQADEYINRQCRLDLYLPKGVKDFPVIVWFHAGGLTSGSKEIPEALKNQQVGVVSVQYRFHPQVTAPQYIEDAAAAVAWVFDNIQNYGGQPNRIFLSGHSAGGYLDLMLGMDKKWLAVHGIDADQIAGMVPFSGHTITHFTIRKEMGIAGEQPLIDQYAPLFHVRAGAPPILLITGDREKELLGRYEENAYFYRMMKVNGARNIDLLEMQGYGHGMVYPAIPLLLQQVKDWNRKIKTSPNP